jgi:hypothetical protein
VTYQTTLNRKCGRLVWWAALDFCFRLARLKQPHWRKKYKSSPFSEPKPLKAKWNLRSPGKIRNARDEGFQETFRTCEDPNKTPKQDV